MKYYNIAIKSNDYDLSIKVIEKLEKEEIISKGKMKPNQLTYMYYIPRLDIIVSGLNLEMHYPEYIEVYGSDFIKT